MNENRKTYFMESIECILSMGETIYNLVHSVGYVASSPYIHVRLLLSLPFVYVKISLPFYFQHIAHIQQCIFYILYIILLCVYMS